MIKLIDVTKSFGSHKVLDSITCDIETGKITVFIGPSGVGKSVLIKHIVGLIKPDRGQIFINDQEVTSMREKEIYRLRRKFGMLFQDGALFDSFTVGQNVAFPIIQHTRKKEGEVKKIVQEKLALVGLEGIEDMMPAELSGGMRKRVGLARAIAMEPEIVFFDEPSSGLDPITANAIDNLIAEMHRKLNITFVVISHDIYSTMTIGHKVGLLYETRLLEYGTPKEIAGSRNPILREFFSRCYAEGVDGLDHGKEQ
jgi:phospholipid/cholesterol/gamma-HCH transport system ATP-binding protein